MYLSPSRGRLWDCMRFVLHRQDSVAELGASIMQQADVAALWLLEALVLTLPQSLLQAYVIVSTDVGLISPGQISSPSRGASSNEDKASHFLFSLPVGWACGLCLLSISWALVLYNRACCLIRPGHLAMPPAAMLCQLVWRAGMLGTRVACLMLFARVFNWWVCGVAGEQVTHLQAHRIVCNVTELLRFYLQASTGSQPHSGSYPSSQTSVLVPGAGALLTPSWGSFTSSSSSTSKTGLHASAWPVFTQ